MKALENMARVQISNELMLMLLSLYESKGKSFYYDELFQRDASAFDKKALEADVIAIAKGLGLSMTDARIRLFAKRDPIPKTKDETRLLNIKTALVQLRNNPEGFEIIPNEVADLAKVLQKDLEPIKFKTIGVSESSILSTKKTKNKRDDLEILMATLSKLSRSREYELTQLITNFYVDFLNMDLLTKENTLVANILLYALLFKSFPVFKYAPFFPYFMAQKDGWEHAVVSAHYYWSEGFAQTDMLSRIIITLLNDVYKDVDQMAHEYMFEKDLNKSDNIENTIMKLDDLFTKEDIRKRHPNVSDATIDRTLKRMKEEDKIRPIGVGRGSKWHRMIPGNKKYGMKQMSLFEE